MIKANVLIHTCIPYTYARTHTCITEHTHTHTHTHTHMVVNKINLLVARSRHLSGCFWLFAPKFLGGAGNLRMVLCHSMNAGSMVGIPWGGRGTQTLPYA